MLAISGVTLPSLTVSGAVACTLVCTLASAAVCALVCTSVRTVVCTLVCTVAGLPATLAHARGGIGGILAATGARITTGFVTGIAATLTTRMR